MKIIWAVDLLGDEGLEAPAVDVLRTLSAGGAAHIQPVFVLCPAHFANDSDAQPRWEDAFRALAEKKMAELPDRVSPLTLREGVLLETSGVSLPAAVQALTEHALATEADAIVVSTHARKGVARVFLGSFAERLLLDSRVPVISVSPHTRPSAAIRSILHPTDFGQPSRRAFESAVELAVRLGARLTLFYKEPLILLADAPGAPPILMPRTEGEASERMDLATAWIGWAQGRGCDIHLQMDEHPGNVAEAINAYSTSKGMDLVTMASQSGPVSAALLGSVARDVVRGSTCPVWVRHA